MNANERIAYDALVQSGSTVLRNGWPDFLVVRATGEVFGLEWKELGDRVAAHQELMHQALALAGIPTLVTGSLPDVFRFRPEPVVGRKSVALGELLRSGV